MSLLRIKNLCLKLVLKKEPLFENQSLDLNWNERISMMGPSGRGKTLFLRSVCFLEPQAQGQIFWQGKLVLAKDVPAYRSQVIYVGQQTELPRGSVQNAFDEVFRLKIHSGKIWNIEKTRKAFQDLGKPEDFLSRPVRHLSGGEKQMVSLLRAVALRPEILCLDEPTSALDEITTLKMENWLKENYSGAWIWITHQRDQAQRVGKRMIEFSKE